MLAFVARRRTAYSRPAFCPPARSAIEALAIPATLSQKSDAPTNMPCDRARGRRRHAHALGAAEGAAPARRTHAARACARRDRRAPAATEIAVVVGPDHDAVAARSASAGAAGADLRAERAARHRACGAGGAPAIARKPDDILVMFADTPLVRARDAGPTARGACRRAPRSRCSDFTPADPTGYGRLVMRGRRTHRHPRGARRERRGARDRASAMAG